MQAVVQRPPFEVADVFRAHAAKFIEQRATTSEQRKVIRHISDCRTAALGGHVDACDSCGHTRISYNSCRDRHCPKCQNLKKAEWLVQRKERLLPIHYFHVVFTLPDELNELILRNRTSLFDLLFLAASQTLREIGRDPKHLGAQIGFTAILHTWGQQLQFHPHLHCVVTGGGIALDGSRWIKTKQNFLFPVKVLGRLFRGKFLAELKQLHDSGKLVLTGACASLDQPGPWKRLLDRLYAVDWVVYSKAPFGSPEQVFQYLGRYTHRVALSNDRLVDVGEDEVALRYRDYRDQRRTKILRVSPAAFIRRFLLHVLPQRFVKIRHYGLLAGKNAPAKLQRARELLAAPSESTTPSAQPGVSSLNSKVFDKNASWDERLLALTGIDIFACPACKTGRLSRQSVVLPSKERVFQVPILNSS